MRNTVTLTVGLPASGKTQWAMLNATSNRIIVCRDDLRIELFGPVYKFSGAKEKEVTRVQKERAVEALRQGKSVIVADTNLNPGVRSSWEHLAKTEGAEVEYNYFTDVSLKTLLKRDAKRADGVGETVIKGMADLYADQIPWAISPRVYVPNKSLRPAIVVDIDGTVADMAGKRGPYEWDKVGLDQPHIDVIDLVVFYAQYNGLQTIFLSGRDECSRAETSKWLRQHFPVFVDTDNLFMRPEGSMEPDWRVKEALFYEHVAPKWNVKMVFDDRDQVVKMWRKMGLRCLQVAEGDF